MILHGVPRRQSAFEEFPAPFSQTLEVAADEALLFSPTSSLRRMWELHQAREGETVTPDLGAVGSGSVERDQPSSRRLSADEARQIVKDEGVSLEIPDAGVRREVLDILVDRKKDELRRQSVLSRAEPGVLRTAGRFGASLGASMLDPLNVAASFIPAVGPARYAAMLERAGSTASRMGVRARVGAAEGFAGFAAVEPIVIAATRQEQAEYGMMDTLLNLAIGTVLGGGLHMGVGTVAELRQGRRPTPDGELPQILERTDPATREAALRAGISQGVTGRQIDVEPVLRAGEPDPLDPRQLFPTDPPPAREFNLGPFERGRYSSYSELSPGDMRAVEMVVRELEGTEPGTRTFLERDRQGSTPEVIGTRATTPEWFQERNREATRINRQRRRALERNRRAGREVEPVPESQPILSRSDVRRVADKLKERKPLGKREGEIAEELFAVARDLREREVRDRLSAREGRHLDDERSVDAMAQREEELIAAARHSFEPENQRLADFEAARATEEELSALSRDDRQLVEESLSDIMEDVNMLARNLGDEDLPARELTDFDGLIRTSEEYGNAVRAAADCRLRRS